MATLSVHAQVPGTSAVATKPLVGLPDIQFIKSKVPIADVARALGLQVFGSTARCWRSENHQHGDRTPSVGLDTKHNRIRCFVCDPLAYSNIDLVQKVIGCDTRTAVEWIAARFPVPTIPKRRHLRDGNEFPTAPRVGCGRDLEFVVRSGLWAMLTAPDKSVLVVLSALSDQVEPLQLSYRGIRRYSGIRSDTTVRKALNDLERLHIVHITRGAQSNGLRKCNTFELTLDDPALHRLMNELREQQRLEIDAERQLRERERKARVKQRLAAASHVNSEGGATHV